MKSYVYNTKKGVIKVRFYKTGCYTVIDPSGNEHEAGQWEKRLMWLDKEKTKLSKDKNSVIFAIKSFDGWKYEDCYCESVAYQIAQNYFYSL